MSTNNTPMTLQDIDRVAALAKLEFSQAEKERLLAELNVMLAHIDTLGGADTSGVEPMVTPFDAEPRLRDDEARLSPPRGEMLKNAPETDGVYFRVPPAPGGRS